MELEVGTVRIGVLLKAPKEPIGLLKEEGVDNFLLGSPEMKLLGSLHITSSFNVREFVLAL